jgi:hypothetical protein
VTAMAAMLATVVPEGLPRTWFTQYCGKPHRTADGAPIAHRCRVLPPEALRAEIDGDLKEALRILLGSGPRKEHGGVWNFRRR